MTLGASPERLRALVLEDEPAARDHLVEMLEGTGLATVLGAVGEFDDATSFLQDDSLLSELDVVFADIHLVGSSSTGLDLVRQFVGVPLAPAFVLITALEKHAVEAFSLGALDYVLKPFDEGRIEQSLRRIGARRVRATEPPQRIIARKRRSLVFLLISEVQVFEAAHGLTLVHTERGTFDMDLSLETLEAVFRQGFSRVHRKWLVNEEHVLEMTREAGETSLLVGSRASGARILAVPVGRERSALVRARLTEGGFGIRRR